MPSSLPGTNVPSPSPSNVSTSSKRKHASLAPTTGSSNTLGTPGMASAAPRKTAVEQQREAEYRPTETLGQIQIAIQHLKETQASKSFDELLRYMSLHRAGGEAIAKLERILKSGKHHKIDYDSRTGTFKYRPLLPVHDEGTLKTYLGRRKNMIGVKVEDIKDGWPDCVSSLESMAGRGEILLVRSKPSTKGPQVVDFSSHSSANAATPSRSGKDTAPKVVWGSDATLVHQVPEDLRRQWMSVTLPLSDETLRQKLLDAGLKPSTQAPTVVAQGPVKPKARKPRKNARGVATNANVPMRDYSHLRK